MPVAYLLRASSNGRASVLHTEGGSSILSVRTLVDVEDYKVATECFQQCRMNDHRPNNRLSAGQDHHG